MKSEDSFPEGKMNAHGKTAFGAECSKVEGLYFGISPKERYTLKDLAMWQFSACRLHVLLHMSIVE